MPRSARPLPSGIEPVFLVRDLESHGVSQGRARRADLDRRVRGVRARAGASDDLRERCRMHQLRLPDSAFFSGPTAALILGAPLPFRLEGGDLHVTVAAPMRAPHARGIIGHSKQICVGDVHESAGIRHSSPARLLCELARDLELDDLVAVGDHLIHHRSPLLHPATLKERTRQGDRISLSRNLNAAVPLLDDHSESRPESRLRVMLVLGGLPKPLVNHTLVMTDGGGRLRPDFIFTSHRVALEYQGDYHRTRAQWRKDMTRRSRLEAAGWTVVELNADDLKYPRELCERVRAILARRR